MAILLNEADRVEPHRVEFYRGKKWLVQSFDNAGEAYRFWIYLKRGTLAKLYQNGKLTGQGTG
jgi:hypothetical protein